MWEVPRYRIRRYVRHLRKARQNAPRVQRPEFHIKRTQAELVVLEGLASPKTVIAASVILNDLAPTSVALFSSTQFGIGQKIGLTIEAPKLFFAKGRVVSCKNLSLTQSVFADESYPYRVLIHSEFQSAQEQEAVKRYCQEIYTRHLYPARAA